MICDVDNFFCLTLSRAFPIFGPRSVAGQFGGSADGLLPVWSTTPVGERVMAQLRATKSKAFFRISASGAFDQYLQDIQKLPLIRDPQAERRLGRKPRRWG